MAAIAASATNGCETRADGGTTWQRNTVSRSGLKPVGIYGPPLSEYVKYFPSRHAGALAQTGVKAVDGNTGASMRRRTNVRPTIRIVALSRRLSD